MRVAVVGHTEWVELVCVDRLPLAGEILQAEPVLEVTEGSRSTSERLR